MLSDTDESGKTPGTDLREGVPTLPVLLLRRAPRAEDARLLDVLQGFVHELREAGLDRVNISLDTLDRDRFIQMTRRDELANVLDGIEAAKEAGFAPVKINAVVERGVNDGEIIDLARFGRDRGVEVRFIEFMPLDASGHWLHDKVVGQDEIVAALSAEFPLEPVPARGAAPADTWRYRDGAGIGIQAPAAPRHLAAMRRLHRHDHAVASQ